VTRTCWLQVLLVCVHTTLWAIPFDIAFIRLLEPDNSWINGGWVYTVTMFMIPSFVWLFWITARYTRLARAGATEPSWPSLLIAAWIYAAIMAFLVGFYVEFVTKHYTYDPSGGLPKWMTAMLHGFALFAKASIYVLVVGTLHMMIMKRLGMFGTVGNGGQARD